MPDLTGAGADLAAALEAGAAGIETLDLSEASRGHLLDLAVTAEKVKTWAAAVQAKATAALVEQFETAHEAVCARDREVAHERALEATTLSLSLPSGCRCAPPIRGSRWPWPSSSTRPWREPSRWVGSTKDKPA